MENGRSEPPQEVIESVVASWEGNAEESVSCTDDGPEASVKSNPCQCATRGTVVSSIVILVKTCVGAGTLSLPFAFAQGGLIFSTAVFFIVMLLAIHVGNMLFACKSYTTEVYPEKKWESYSDLAELAFGKPGKIASLLTISISQFLFLTALMILARDQLQDIISFGLQVTGYVPQCSPLVNCTLIMCIAFIPIFPITLFRNLTPLQFITYFSILSVFFVAIAMTVDTTLYWTMNTNISIANEHIQLFPVNFTGSITAISYCSLSFVCQFNLVRLQLELKGRPTKLRLTAINVGYALLSYLIFSVVAYAGYFRFFNDLRENVILNYSRDNYLIIAVRVALLFMLIASYPVGLHPGRDSINTAFAMIDEVIHRKLEKKRKKTNTEQGDGPGEARDSNVNAQNDDFREPSLSKEAEDKCESLNTDNEQSSTKKTAKSTDREALLKNISTIVWFCETFIIFALSFLLASFILNVGIVWNFVSSIGGVLVLYIYPSAIYLKLRYARYRKRAREREVTILSLYNKKAVLLEVLAWFILVIGLILLVLTNYQAVYTVVESTNQGEGSCQQLDCVRVDHWNVTYFGYY